MIIIHTYTHIHTCTYEHTHSLITVSLPCTNTNFSCAHHSGFGRVYDARGAKNKRVAVKRMPHIADRDRRRNLNEIGALKFCSMLLFAMHTHASTTYTFTHRRACLRVLQYTYIHTPYAQHTHTSIITHTLPFSVDLLFLLFISFSFLQRVIRTLCSTCRVTK